MSEWFPLLQNCPACDSPAIAFSFKMIYWQDYPLHFFQCKNCDARFANPMPGNALIARGNNALVRHYSRGRVFADEFRDARQAYLRGKLLGRQLSNWKNSGRLLEIGSNNGFFLAGIRDSTEWDVEGVEIAHEPAHFAREKLHLKMHEGVLEELSLAENQYDFIVFNDLIEHITQPAVFLESVVRLLAPGGRVQLITPNANQDTAFAKRASDQGTPIYIMLNHIMFFSPKSLRFAFERVGLRVKKLYSFDVQHAVKDYGLFGLGKVGSIEKGPSLKEVETLPVQDFANEWTPQRLRELRAHHKVSLLYGFFKETLPHFFSIKVPESVGVGHEIFAVAEKKS